MGKKNHPKSYNTETSIIIHSHNSFLCLASFPFPTPFKNCAHLDIEQLTYKYACCETNSVLIQLAVEAHPSPSHTSISLNLQKQVPCIKLFHFWTLLIA